MKKIFILLVLIGGLFINAFADRVIFITTIKDGRPNLPPDYGEEGTVYLCHNEGDGFSVNHDNGDGTCTVWVQSTPEVIAYMKEQCGATTETNGAISANTELAGEVSAPIETEKVIPEGQVLARDYEWVKDLPEDIIDTTVKSTE